MKRAPHMRRLCFVVLQVIRRVSMTGLPWFPSCPIGYEVDFCIEMKTDIDIKVNQGGSIAIMRKN